MANLNEESGVFGGVQFEENQNNAENYGTIRNQSLPVKADMWSSFKGFWLQDIDWNYEIKVELTPKQEKMEREINDFLHQEITWEGFRNFLFQEVTFGKKN